MNDRANLSGKKATTSLRRPVREGLFVISCAARTGSSMLVNMLQAHPSITCHMEIFNPRKVEGFWGAYRERLTSEPDFEGRLRELRSRDPAVYLYKIAFDSQQRAVAGFKFKHEEFLLPSFAGARAAICADTDIKVIMLRRRNLLKRYLSHVLANRTGVTMKRVGEVGPAHALPTLDPRACLEDFQTVGRRTQFVSRMFKDHNVLDIHYEDFAGGEGGKFQAEILTFLGVPPLPLRTVHSKLARDNLAGEIANYAELKEFFANGPYAVFFEA